MKPAVRVDLAPLGGWNLHERAKIPTRPSPCGARRRRHASSEVGPGGPHASRPGRWPACSRRPGRGGSHKPGSIGQIGPGGRSGPRRSDQPVMSGPSHPRALDACDGLLNKASRCSETRGAVSERHVQSRGSEPLSGWVRCAGGKDVRAGSGNTRCEPSCRSDIARLAGAKEDHVREQPSDFGESVDRFRCGVRTVRFVPKSTGFVLSRRFAARRAPTHAQAPGLNPTSLVGHAKSSRCLTQVWAPNAHFRSATNWRSAASRLSRTEPLRFQTL